MLVSKIISYKWKIQSEINQTLFDAQRNVLGMDDEKELFCIVLM
jgi:hypothetical protein